MRIAFIGAVGLPNRYGGFESFLDACAPVMARHHAVHVTCDAGRYPDRSPEWNGVHRLFVPIPANGAMSVFHDAVAFARVLRRVDAIVVLGISGGIFFPLMRLACALTGRRLVVNVDGVEWRRAKFGRAKRWLLRLSDMLAQVFAHAVVVDNAALIPFLTARGRGKAVCIAYSGDQLRTPVAAPQPGRILTICRIEPENNCHILLNAAAAVVGTGEMHYHFVGNWDASDYGRDLRRRFGDRPGFTLHDPVYDEDAVAAQRERCAIYLHGHSVGGTNPSLVEMLFYDCRILAFDCAFNRQTAGDAAEYFRDGKSLADRLVETPFRNLHTRRAMRARYTRAGIVARYMAVIECADAP